MSANKAVEYLSISKRYLQVLRDKRQISFYQRGQLIWYKKKDLDDFINSYKLKLYNSSVVILQLVKKS